MKKIIINVLFCDAKWTLRHASFKKSPKIQKKSGYTTYLKNQIQFLANIIHFLKS